MRKSKFFIARNIVQRATKIRLFTFTRKVVTVRFLILLFEYYKPGLSWYCLKLPTLFPQVQVGATIVLKTVNWYMHGRLSANELDPHQKNSFLFTVLFNKCPNFLVLCPGQPGQKMAHFASAALSEHKRHQGIIFLLSELKL